MIIWYGINFVILKITYLYTFEKKTYSRLAKFAKHLSRAKHVVTEIWIKIKNVFTICIQVLMHYYVKHIEMYAYDVLQWLHRYNDNIFFYGNAPGF